MPKLQALWFGGYSYAPPYEDDAETFESIEAAKQEFIRRYHNRNGRYPCVDDTCEMWLFFGEEGSFDYPDRIIRFGPRGGVRVDPT